MRKIIFKYRGTLLLPSALILLVFGKPSVSSLIYGMMVLLLGEAIRIWGVGYAGVTTRSDKVEAPFLVTSGPYAYVRNPLYVGNFFVGLGFCIIACGHGGLCLNLFMAAFYLASYILVYGSIIPLEEEFLKKTFGEDYINYTKYVPRLIPFKKPYDNKKGNFSWSPVISGEKHTIIYLGIAFIYFCFRAFKVF